MIIHHLDPKSPTSIPSSTTATTLQPFLAAIPVDPPGVVVVATGATVPSEPPPEPLPEPEPLVEPGPLPDSVRNGAGRGRTTFRRPVPSFPKLARQVRTKDQDGRHCVVPSSHFLNLPDK